MCSIGGFLTSSPIDPDYAFQIARGLIYYGQERGRQSSGIYLDGRVLKRAQDPYDFIMSKGFRKLFQNPSAVCLTHTRQPTMGGTGDAQAQPFRVNNTVTVHNGMLMNCKDLKQRFSIPKPSGVDSELFTRAIDKHGIDVLPTFLDAAWGSSAVAAWYNGALYLMRDGGPIEYLHFQIDKVDYLVFGSTEAQVLNACRHAFLIPQGWRTTSLRANVLFHAKASALEARAEQVHPSNIGTTGRTYGWSSLTDEERKRWGLTERRFTETEQY